MNSISHIYYPNRNEIINKELNLLIKTNNISMINIFKGFLCFCEECKEKKKDFNFEQSKNDIIINDSYETINPIAFDNPKKKTSRKNNTESEIETSECSNIFTTTVSYPKLFFTFTKQKVSKKSFVPLSYFKQSPQQSKIKDIRKDLMNNIY